MEGMDFKREEKSVAAFFPQSSNWVETKKTLIAWEALVWMKPKVEERAAEMMKPIACEHDEITKEM